MDKLELRLVNTEFESTDDGLRVSGYVNKTNQWSQQLGVRKKFVERILPGTFQRSLQSGNEVHFYAEHDPSKILSSTRNGSLSLREDENGLYMEATIAPTSWGNDYHTLIKEGIINNMSFGMKVLKDSWRKLNDGTYERSISDIYLAEVSAVRNPAYIQSTIAARSIEVIEDVEVPDEIENENREESNQMELELRDKLAEVLDKILVHLESAPKAEPVVEQPKTEEPKAEVVAETPKAEEKTPEKIEEKAPEVEPKAEETPKAEEKVEEKAPEVVKEEAPKVEEKAPEKVEEQPKDEPKTPDLSEFYKKLLELA